MQNCEHPLLEKSGRHLCYNSLFFLRMLNFHSQRFIIIFITLLSKKRTLWENLQEESVSWRKKSQNQLNESTKRLSFQEVSQWEIHLDPSINLFLIVQKRVKSEVLRCFETKDQISRNYAKRNIASWIEFRKCWLQ